MAKEEKVEGLESLMVELRHHPIFSKLLEQLDNNGK